MDSERRAASDELRLAVLGRRQRRTRPRIGRSRSLSVEGQATVDDRGWTPLHVASFTGSMEQVRRMLEEGAGVDEASRGPKHPGATPLHLAAAAGHVPVIEMLLEGGANIEARTRGAFGWTPLHLAAKNNHRRAVRFLVESGAFLAPDISDLRFNPPLHYCRGRGMEYAYECLQALERAAEAC